MWAGASCPSSVYNCLYWYHVDFTEIEIWYFSRVFGALNDPANYLQKMPNNQISGFYSLRSGRLELNPTLKQHTWV